MKLKHALIICLAVFFIISQVSADENIDEFINCTNITFEGIGFSIPVGFNESKDSEDFTDLGSDGETCFYVNDAQGEIIITVISDWMGLSLDELKQPGSKKAEINGYTGWNYTKDNLHYFAYIKDDKGVIVGVTNETRLSQVIV